MRILRPLAIGALLACLALSAPHSALAKNKAGSACPTLGKTVVVGKTKLSCKRVQGKRIWVKVAVVQPKVEPTNTATGTAQPTTTTNIMDVLLYPKSPNEGDFCSSEGHEHFAVQGPIRCVSGAWRLVARDQDSVMSRAFRYVRERWLTSQNDPVNSEIYVKPSTGQWGTWAVTAYEAGARYWRADSNRMMVRAIISDDGLWLEAKARELNWPIGETLTAALRRRPWDNQAVNGSYPQTLTSGEYWTHILVEGAPHPGLNTGIPHEFGHIAQIYYANHLLERSGPVNRVPWLNEGMNSYVGAALSPLYGSRHNTRDEWVDRMVQLDVSLSEVANQVIAPGGSAIFRRAYAAGFFATEALTAVYGAEIIDDLYRDFGETRSINSSFRRVLGVDQTTAMQTLDAYIQSVRLGKPWTLRELQSNLDRAGFKPHIP